LEDALGAFERCIELDPAFVYAYSNLSVVLGHSGQLEQALLMARIARTLAPENGVHWGNEAVVLRDLGRLDEALAAHDRSLQLEFRDPQQTEGDRLVAKAHVSRAITLIHLGRDVEALESVVRAFKIDPDPELRAGFYSSRGVRAYREGRYKKALADFNHAIELDGAKTVVAHHFNRGNALKALARFEEAIAAYDTVLAQDPAPAQALPALVNRAYALAGMKRRADALRTMARALELDPDSSHAVILKGCLQKGPREALACFNRALVLDPGNAEAHFHRARALQALERRSDAMDAYETAVRAGHQDPQLANNLAWFRATTTEAELRDPVRAVEMARLAVKRRPMDRACRNTLGVALYYAGANKACVETLLPSTRGDGDSFDWFFLAMAKHELGQEDASAWFEKAVAWMHKHKPEDEDLKRFRAEASKLLGIAE
jgi:tetratricopeptide (TPR) repeat protein